MLPTSSHQLTRLTLAICIGVLSTSLTACALLPSESLTSENSLLIAATATMPGYPAPAATPTAPLPSVSHNDLIATPLPSERVVAGAIVEIPDSKDNLPYTYRREHTTSPDGSSFSQLFVQYQGQEIRLGDDSGSSHLEATSEKYLTWRYLALQGDETNLPLKSGLYFYEIKNGRLTKIADGRRVGFSETDGEWVVYTAWENAVPITPTVGGEVPSQLIPVLAYHIASRKTITLSTSVPVIMGRSIPGFYGIGDNNAGWVEYDVPTQQYSLKVSNLNNGRVQTLNVPDLNRPLSFSISADLAVWRDTYWHGYSLAHNALFTVPYAPPGWENGFANIDVMARPAGLEWRVKVSDKEVRYFRAPVILRGQGATAWESLVIPLHQTLAPPTLVPLEGTPPVAYP